MAYNRISGTFDTCRLCGGPKTKFIKDRGLRCEPCWIAKRQRNRGTTGYIRRKTCKRVRSAKIKIEVLSWYGGGVAACVCCKESAREFLCIDHTKGGGSKHRKEKGLSGERMYRWLKRNGFPAGYRTLCQNCNSSLGAWGYCPHGNIDPVTYHRSLPATIAAFFSDTEVPPAAFQTT